MLRYFMAFYL